MPPASLTTLVLALATLIAGGPPREQQVAVRTFKFRPDTAVVPVASRVIWSNEDEIEHTVTADSGVTGVRLDGALSGKGTTFQAIFAKPGLYPYHCERHQFMRGVVRVLSPGAKP